MKNLFKFATVLLVLSPGFCMSLDQIVGGVVVSQCDATDIQDNVCSNSPGCAGQEYAICVKTQGFTLDLHCQDGVGAQACQQSCGGFKNAESEGDCTPPPPKGPGN